MAEVVANLRMEYGPNTFTLARVDDLGEAEAFSASIDTLSFVVARMDSPAVKVIFTVEDISSEGDLTVLAVFADLSNKSIYKSGDNIYTPKIDEFKHIYSLVNGEVNVIMTGKVQLFEVAT